MTFGNNESSKYSKKSAEQISNRSEPEDLEMDLLLPKKRTKTNQLEGFQEALEEDK